ncbi:MAG TPA: hypothetical protein VK623_05280 [Flavobacterium sp.]|nr:hypothetical protein [Flavobacterium sp.]
MDTIGIIGFILMLIGFANAAWVLILYILSMSALFGTHLSKKVGTANERTDGYIEQGKSVSNDLLVKLIWRLAIGIIGLVMYYIATYH